MNMINEIIKGRIFFIVSAILVNGLILLMIPQLSKHEDHQDSKPFFNAIFVTKYEPPPSPMLHPRRKQPKPEKKKPDTLPKVFFKQKKVQTKPPQLNFEIPNVSFEIHPKLKTRMTIAPPLIEKKPEPAVALRSVEKKPESAVVVAPPSVEQKTGPVARPTVPQPVPAVRSFPAEFGMDEVDEKPRVLQKVNPVYPHRAKRRNIKGKVTVKFLVSVSGDVTKPSVVEAKPEGVFEQSVLQAIQRWRFKPGYYQGKPVPTWVILPIQFNLKT